MFSPKAKWLTSLTKKQNTPFTNHSNCLPVQANTVQLLALIIVHQHVRRVPLERYRIQCDRFDGLWLVVQQLITRLHNYFADAKDDIALQVSFTGPVPLKFYFELIDNHFEVCMNLYLMIFPLRKRLFVGVNCAVFYVAVPGSSGCERRGLHSLLGTPGAIAMMLCAPSLSTVIRYMTWSKGFASIFLLFIF